MPRVELNLGIRRAWRRRRLAGVIDADYLEARRLAALSHAPAGATLPAPADPAGPLDVAIVVPPFSRGSGGHMTIANLVRGLEARGHRFSIWIDDPGARSPGGGRTAAADLRDWFGPFAADVTYGLDGFRGADVVVATGWQTVARVRTLPAAARAYLVQDHEPEFFGTSVQRSFAEASYGMGLYPITAGTWLAEVMRERYGLAATPFRLGIDTDLYHPDAAVRRREDVVLAYARRSTPRRAVPIALAALAELVERRPQTEVWLFGSDGPAQVDFPHRDLGVVGARDLPALYREATVGLVLSMTNYSLVAQEMLACELACVELDAPSSRAAFAQEGMVELVPLDPVPIAERVAALLDDPAERARRAAHGEDLRARMTWAAAAAEVEEGLRAALRAAP